MSVEIVNVEEYHRAWAKVHAQEIQNEINVLLKALSILTLNTHTGRGLEKAINRRTLKLDKFKREFDL